MSTTALIQAVEEADSASRLVETVYQLASVRDETAIPTLIKVLGFNNPGAAVAAVNGLIQLGDEAVPVLLEQLDGYNYGARAWAIRALAGIGDPRALDVLLDAAQADFALSVRRAAARGLGTLRWHQLALNDVQPAQTRALEALIQVSHDPEWVVRYAAVVALQSLAIATHSTRPDWFTHILNHFQHRLSLDEDAAVGARIKMAQHQLARLA
ncbi:MAG: HEAT repeat domain-containing protein [Elainellaceae cyanobacterium]